MIHNPVSTVNVNRLDQRTSARRKAAKARTASTIFHKIKPADQETLFSDQAASINSGRRNEMVFKEGFKFGSMTLRARDQSMYSVESATAQN